MTAQQYPPIIDGHNDTVLEITAAAPNRRRSFFDRGGFGHLDLPRAKDGGLGGGFWLSWGLGASGSGGSTLGLGTCSWGLGSSGGWLSLGVGYMEKLKLIKIAQ